ncbi:hypothetical protein E2C01_039874 [Portunus trituberculatus]|uniref:Uncharacterized protein n=1 Tax=Portunus trituberculatus TaxID=210409 RepID=A0A5B7FL63_PORTR|nr:hypothetical protein [Portunus trituberculatus]
MHTIRTPGAVAHASGFESADHGSNLGWEIEVRRKSVSEHNPQSQASKATQHSVKRQGMGGHQQQTERAVRQFPARVKGGNISDPERSISVRSHSP